MTRRFDLVLYGATGFTGGLVADYLAGVSGREKLRWALAGRNLAKLESVLARIKAVPGALLPEILQADADDAASLREMAQAATAVISTVGPYMRFGEPVVAACADAGTHYVDLTGEPAFTEKMRAKYQSLAAASGARIINSCGFESIPPDIAVLAAVNELRGRLGSRFASTDVVVKGAAEGFSLPSGGTWHSAVGAMASAREWLRDRPAPIKDNVHALNTPLLRNRDWNCWALNAPTIDPEVVRHSARVRGDYGQRFTYGHFVANKNPLALAGMVVGLGGVFALAQFEPTRNWLLKQRQPGDGPDALEREKNWFHMHVSAEGGGEKVVLRMSGGDPFYGDTAKMIAEAALALALEKDLPAAAGVITPASGIGEVLVPRLQRAGLRFEVLA
ncbi:MAG: saccharopine dehydrogenase family protein [Moraxellaceae bacterium]